LSGLDLFSLYTYNSIDGFLFVNKSRRKNENLGLNLESRLDSGQNVAKKRAEIGVNKRKIGLPQCFFLLNSPIFIDFY